MSDSPSQPSNNPFAASNLTQPDYTARRPEHGQPGRGYVRQIPTLAIMTIVQGALLTMMGMVLIGYGIFFAVMLRMEETKLPPNAPPLGIISAAGIGIGVIVLLIAAMHIFAGIRNLKYRGRTLTITDWMLGLLPQ